jgi:hypothetical protein
VNIRLSYHYIDRTNCRQYTSIILEGSLTWTQIEPYLVRQSYFIPSQIGLEDLRQRFALPGLDQPWHEISATDLRPTEHAPTVSFSTEELVRRFAEVTWAPNLQSAMLNSISSQPAAASRKSS